MTEQVNTYVSMNYKELLQHIEPLIFTRDGFRIVGMLTPGGDLATGYETSLTRHGDVAFWAWGLVRIYVSPAGLVYRNTSWDCIDPSPQRLSTVDRYQRQFLGDFNMEYAISEDMTKDHGETFMAPIMESLRKRLY